MAMLLAVAVLTIAPWTIRNAVVMDAFIPVSTNSSATLWVGHNPNADGGPNYATKEVLAPIAGAKGRDFEVEEARLLRREALEHVVEHPLRELYLIPLKLISLNRGDSRVIDTWINGRDPVGVRPGGAVQVRERPPVIGAGAAAVLGTLADAAYYALLGATLVSLLLFGRRLWRNRLLRGALAMLAISLVTYGFVYYGNFRYRIPLEPLMMLVAAPLLVRPWQGGGRRGEADAA
jgi:hypothetical protein